MPVCPTVYASAPSATQEERRPALCWLFDSAEALLAAGTPPLHDMFYFVTAASWSFPWLGWAGCGWGASVPAPVCWHGVGFEGMCRFPTPPVHASLPDELCLCKLMLPDGWIRQPNDSPTLLQLALLPPTSG